MSVMLIGVATEWTGYLEFHHNELERSEKALKKVNVFLVIGCVMVVAAICFVAYAIYHPWASFPWPNEITYTIYALYIVLTIFMFIKSVRVKKK